MKWLDKAAHRVTLLLLLLSLSVFYSFYLCSPNLSKNVIWSIFNLIYLKIYLYIHTLYSNGTPKIHSSYTIESIHKSYIVYICILALFSALNIASVLNFKSSATGIGSRFILHFSSIFSFSWYKRESKQSW